MHTVLLVVHLLIIVALVFVVLLQRSEGGALGIGGGGGGAGLMTGRGTANLLTRTTAILAGLFMMTSLALSIWSSSAGTQRNQSIMDQAPAVQTEPAAPSEPSVPVQ
ncbi:preprotein translocase subunit SecG [Rhodovibrionaceae bacterium A322]